MLDGVRGDPAHPAHTAIKRPSTDGALVVSEVDYLSHGTKAAIGIWGYTARFEDVGTFNPAPPSAGTWGVCVRRAAPTMHTALLVG